MSQRYVVGDGSPFLKRVIVPFYIVRIVVLLLNIIVYSAAIAYAVNDEFSIQFGNPTVVVAVIAVILAIIVVCLVLDITCIVKRSRRTLTPLFFLVANCINTGIWTILFILNMMGVGRNAVSIIISIMIYASFVGLLIYASVIFHRHRKGTLRGNYSPANQPTEYTSYANDEPAKPHHTQPYEMERRYA